MKCIWSLESEGPLSQVASERILPDGCVEIVFHFKDPFLSRFAVRETALQPRSFVVGQMKQFLEIEPAGRVGFLAVRFHARGAYRFLPPPLSAIANDAIDLRELWGHDADARTERIALARTEGSRIAIVENMLFEWLRKNERDEQAVDRCLGMIAGSGGQLSVKQLAATVGLSKRQLRRRFTDAVGVTPKEFSRVQRFLAAVSRLRRGPQDQLADLALDCGYFDQAHFNHDFREFAGMTPREFFSRRDVVV